jgi:glycosyltransferase involved in cell wall biosynthesis
MAGWDLVKVALLSDCYLPRLGGIEVQVHDLARALTGAGHRVEVFTATGAAGGGRDQRPRVEADGLTVHRFDLGLPGGIPINPFVTGEVGRRLTAGGFDVAHVHRGVVSPFAVDMARVALGAGVPTAVTWHCVLDGSAPIHRLLGYAGRWAARGAALSAVSSMAAERVRRILPPGVEVGVLNNGIDVAAWRRPAALAPGPVFRVVAVQRLASRKRPRALTDVLRQARVALPSEVALEAVVVGDGPARAGLLREAAGMPWLSVPGRLTRDDLRALLWTSHAFLSTTRLEAFGIAALEARTAGLPVIALRDNGIGDFVADGVNGLLAADDAGLADSLARLAGDDALRSRLTAYTLSTPPRQDWGSTVTATLAEYERARAGHPS